MTEPPSYTDILNTLNDLTDRLQALPPPRTEPFKFTPGQWAQIRLRLPPAPVDPYSFTGSTGWLTGVPVVLVDDEAESTPIVEGWWSA